jgi:hypothetical protein
MTKHARCRSRRPQAQPARAAVNLPNAIGWPPGRYGCRVARCSLEKPTWRKPQSLWARNTPCENGESWVRPLQRVRVLQHIRANKWKAQWLEPNPGMTDYVESGQIVVLSRDHKAFLRDEANSTRLPEINKREGVEPDLPIVEAVQQVFESMGDDIRGYRDTVSGTRDAFSRIKSRAKYDDAPEPHGAYTDRHGTVYWPFQSGLELARKFCAAEPSTVLVGIEEVEREWATKASRPGEEYIIPLLSQYRASLALIRQWTGHDPAVQNGKPILRNFSGLCGTQSMHCKKRASTARLPGSGEFWRNIALCLQYLCCLMPQGL